MRIPDPLFRILNPLVAALLRSPLHGFCSGSLLLIRFTGRHSGRCYTTPLRYLREGDRIRLFSSTGTQWWRNLRGGAPVVLLLKGAWQAWYAEVMTEPTSRISAELAKFLQNYPGDAAYFEVRVRAGGIPDEDDIAAAARHSVMVEARPQGRETGSR